MSFFARLGSQAVRSIRTANSLEQIQSIVSQFPAKAPSSGAVLYSGPIGSLRSESVALSFAKQSGVSIINDTPRAQFLSDPVTMNSIKFQAVDIIQKSGHSPADAEKLAGAFLFGDHKQPSHSPMSVEGCLWGQASKEFAESVHGKVHVVATSASPDRVLGKVEIPTAMGNDKIDLFGGQQMFSLRELYQKAGIDPILPLVQKPCVEAVQKGIYQSSNGKDLMMPKEFYNSFGIDTSKFTIAIPPITGLIQVHPSQPSPSITTPTPKSTPTPTPTTPDPSKSAPASDVSKKVEGMLAALKSGDSTAVQKSMHGLADSTGAHQMQAQAATTVSQTTQQQPTSRPTAAQPSGEQPQTAPQTGQATQQNNSGSTGPHR